MMTEWEIDANALDLLIPEHYELGDAKSQLSEKSADNSLMAITNAPEDSKEIKLLDGILKAIGHSRATCLIATVADLMANKVSLPNTLLVFESVENSLEPHQSATKDQSTFIYCHPLSTYMSDINQKKELWQALKLHFDI